MSKGLKGLGLQNQLNLFGQWRGQGESTALLLPSHRANVTGALGCTFRRDSCSGHLCEAYMLRDSGGSAKLLSKLEQILAL